jgi:hypothetical protein
MALTRVTLAALVLTQGACQERVPESTSREVPLDSQVAALEEFRDSLPLLYQSLRAIQALGAQMSLNELGFRTGPYTGTVDAATEAATRDFESARQLPVTGNPFARTTFRRLLADAERVTKSSRPGVRSFNAFGWSSGVFFAEGPWVTAGLDIPAGIRIHCDRYRRECIIAEAEYGPETSLGQIGLVPVIDTYQIAVWDAAEIRSRPSDSQCQRVVLVINRIEESVTLDRTPMASGRFCSTMNSDATAIYNRTAHLATTAEIASMNTRFVAALFDTLLRITPDLKRALSAMRDTAAFRTRSRPARPN